MTRRSWRARRGSSPGSCFGLPGASPVPAPPPVQPAGGAVPVHGAAGDGGGNGFEGDGPDPVQGDQPDRADHGLRAGVCPEPARCDASGPETALFEAKTASGRCCSHPSAAARRSAGSRQRNSEKNDGFRNSLATGLQFRQASGSSQGERPNRLAVTGADSRLSALALRADRTR